MLLDNNWCFVGFIIGLSMIVAGILVHFLYPFTGAGIISIGTSVAIISTFIQQNKNSEE